MPRKTKKFNSQLTIFGDNILAMHAQISNKRKAKNTQDKCFSFLWFKK